MVHSASLPVHTRLRGFTLIEMLVVMSMLSLIMLGLGSVMSSVAQTEERVDVRLNRADEARVAVNFLKTTLGRVSQRRLDPPPEVGQNRFMFSAGPDAMVWLGIMPARYGAGGRTFFRLALEKQTDSTQVLMLRFLPWEGENQLPDDWSAATTRVLVSDVQQASFSYEDNQVAPEKWMSAWEVEDHLPSHVAIALQTGAYEWPQVLVPVRVLPSSGAGYGGGFSVGGGGVE